MAVVAAIALLRDGVTEKAVGLLRVSADASQVCRYMADRQNYIQKGERC